MFFGELGLDGRLRPVCGVLPAVAEAASAGFGKVMVAEQNAAEAVLVPGVRVIAANSLTGAADWLRGLPGPGGGPAAVEFEGGQELSGGRVRGAHGAVGGAISTARAISGGPTVRMAASGTATAPDLAELLGQSMARRAAEVCAAGGHHLSLLGPPGVGKPAPGLAHDSTARRVRCADGREFGYAPGEGSQRPRARTLPASWSCCRVLRQVTSRVEVGERGY